MPDNTKMGRVRETVRTMISIARLTIAASRETRRRMTAQGKDPGVNMPGALANKVRAADIAVAYAEHDPASSSPVQENPAGL